MFIKECFVGGSDDSDESVMVF
ncbi:hypothetical protein A2U01_0072371, partial [Trifolium medium]|nr:hypothetical protein [Trifolium medium]